MRYLVIASLLLGPLVDGSFMIPQDGPASVQEAEVTGNLDGWESMIRIYFEPEDWAWARHIIQCESGGYSKAYNKSSGASGLFQFIPSTWEFAKPWPNASPYDPTAAFMAARWLLDNLGKGQWSCTRIMGY